MHGADAGAPLQRQVCGTDRFIVAIIVYRVAEGCAKDLIADLITWSRYSPRVPLFFEDRTCGDSVRVSGSRVAAIITSVAREVASWVRVNTRVLTAAAVAGVSIGVVWLK